MENFKNCTEYVHLIPDVKFSLAWLSTFSLALYVFILKLCLIGYVHICPNIHLMWSEDT